MSWDLERIQDHNGTSRAELLEFKGQNRKKDIMPSTKRKMESENRRQGQASIRREISQTERKLL